MPLTIPHDLAYPGPEAPGADLLLRLFTRHDGSTTRLCEALVDAPVEVQVRHQRLTTEVPGQVRALLPHGPYIERVASLVAHGRVLTDNLVYAGGDGLDDGLREALWHGRVPIGHALGERWVRRDAVAVDDEVLQPLWRTVGAADTRALRSYCMRTPRGAVMLVCEAFRRGLWDCAGRMA